jgi:hypothetical protein
MTLSGPYQKLSASSCKIGGERFSVSGNLRTTSTSFSTGINTGLHGRLSTYVLEWNFNHLQLFQHFNFALYTGSSVGVEAESVDEFLHVGPVLHLCFVLSLLVFMLFCLCLHKSFIVASAKKHPLNFFVIPNIDNLLVRVNPLSVQMEDVSGHRVQEVSVVRNHKERRRPVLQVVFQPNDGFHV